MLKRLAITIVLISALAAYCNKGCLKCTSDNECLYCDATQFYLLVDGRCIASPIDGCVQMDEKGKCVTCKENYYVDPVKYTCIALPSTLQVTNCAEHIGPQSCNYCKTGYVLVNGSCQQTANVIANCTHQNAKGDCLTCATGYMRNATRDGCVAVPSADNCATYNTVQCLECQSGYTNNPNRYIDIIFNFKNSNQINSLNYKIADEANNVVDNSVFKTCQSNIVANCDTLIDYQTCADCSFGYYLTYDKKCKANPIAAIPNCNKYSAVSTCVECKQGYYPFSASVCAPVSPLMNCLLYDTDKAFTSCKKCIPEYYLSADNICSPRTDLSDIDFCATLHDEEESCVQCLPGYQTTFDNLKCLPLVEQCQTYIKSTINSLRLECSVCNPGFYLNTTYKVCVRGTVDNCLTYVKNADVCNNCEPNFYLVGNTCVPHVQQALCDEYSANKANACSTCKPYTYLFTPANSCVSVSSIDNCTVYASKTTCGTCKDGFYLASPSECKAIPSEYNCLQLNNNLQCVKCLSTYVLDNGSCFDPQRYILDKCANSNLNGLVSSDKLRCNYCKPHNIPINYANTFVCKDKSYIKRTMLRFQDQFDENCLQFTTDANNNLLCVRCENGFVIDSNVCVASCTTAANATVYQQFTDVYDIDGDSINDSVKVTFTDICGPTIPNCAVAVPNVNTDFAKPSYSCAVCNTNNIKTIQIGGAAGLLRRTGRVELPDNEYGSSPVTIVPAVRCVTLLSGNTNVIGQAKDLEGVDGCDYFMQIFPGVFGCNKCKWGKTGIVVDLIKNCAIFSSPQACSSCAENYYRVSDKECMPVINIPFCMTYDTTANSTKCTACDDLHYLSGNACLNRVNSLNVKFSTLDLEGDTVTCNSKFVLNPNVAPAFECRAYPDNCTVANFPVGAGAVPVCTQCDSSKSFLTGGACADGTIANCSEYKPTANECNKCSNGYYKVGNTKCLPHNLPNESNCDVWSQSIYNTCDTCKFDSVKLSVESKCVSAFLTITNCVEYADIYTCKTCNDGYYLENLSKTCSVIPTELNCAVYTPLSLDGNTKFTTGDLTTTRKYVYSCDKCNSKSYRKQTTVAYTPYGGVTPASLSIYKCYPYLTFNEANCTETDVNGLVDFGGKHCTGCNANYFPYDFNTKYVCVENDYITLMQPAFTNCEVIDYKDANTFKCSRCKFGYFIEGDGCVDTCTQPNVAPFNNLAMVLSFTSPATGITFTKGSCIVDATNTYAAADADDFQTGIKIDDQTLAIVINSCPNTKLPLIDYAPSKSYRTYIGPSSPNYNIQSPFDGFEAIKSCFAPIATTKVLGYNNASKMIDKCEFYYNLNTDTYGCMKCAFGYSGRINNDTTSPNLGFIEYCEPISGCDLNITSGMFVSYDNLQKTGLLTRYFSCFSCQDDGTDERVVVSAVAAGTTVGSDGLFAEIYGLRAYQLTTDATVKYKNGVVGLTESKQNFCVKSTGINTTLRLDDPSANIVAKCSAYMLNVDSKGENANDAFFCVACKPGYTPTYVAGSVYKIDTCTIMANCDTSNSGTMVNYCSTCVYTYDLYSDIINYKTCLDLTGGAIARTSCYAAVDKNTCKLCRAGYELKSNADGTSTCYQLTVNNCSSVNYYQDFNLDYKLASTVRDTALYLYSGVTETSSVQGCTACNAGFSLLNVPYTTVNKVDRYVCTSSSITDTRAAAGVTDCKRHGWSYTDTKYLCRECNTNFVLTQDNFCTPANATVLPRCLVATAYHSAICTKCIDPTDVIVGGVCIAAGSASLITNCSQYTAGTKTSAYPVCQTCAATYYLSNNACVSIPDTKCASYTSTDGCVVCKFGYALFKLEQNRNVCLSIVDTSNATNWNYDSNCLEIIVEGGSSPLFDVQAKHLNCKKCKPHSFLSQATADLVPKTSCVNVVIDADASCSAYDIDTTIVGSNFYCTECSSYTTHYLNLFQHKCIARTVVANCSDYDHNLDRCVACNDNYKLNFAGTSCDSITSDVSGKARNMGYIHTCRSMNTCNTDLMYEGLSADLSSFYSCHVCKNASQIPFIAVRTDADNSAIVSLNEFGIANSTGSIYNTGSNGSAVTCIEPVYSNFGVLSANFVFPVTKCALGMVKIDVVANAIGASSASTTVANSSIMCTACQPGYKATTTTNSGNGNIMKYMVSACTEITNCEYSRWFNACTQCSPTYAFSYNATTGINFSECTLYAENPLCYAVSVVGGVKTCMNCKKGSYMNKDGICDLINPPSCEVGSFKFDRNLASKDLLYGLYSQNNGVGCNRCVSGFAAVYSRADTYVCTESLYLVNTTLTNTTKYVVNCVNYTNTPLGKIKCAVCAANYTLTVDGSCTLSTGVPNCKLALSGSKCQTCNSGFVLVNRACQTPSVANCVAYNNDVNAFEQVCTTCAPDYFLVGNACVKGSIANCKNLETATRCNACNDGFTLILGDNNTNFCYPNSAKLNCKTFDANGFQAGILRCTQCSSNNYVISTSTTDFQPTFCMPFSGLDKCIKFNNSLLLSSSSFQCQKCQDDYYLSNGSCIKRTIKPAECTSYDPLAEKCTACAYGFYLAANGASCIAYPEGIKDCIVYSSKSVCSACDTKFYLVDNACVAVVTEIPNCVYYHDANICKTCANNYINVQGACVAPLAQNCETFASLTQCKTCAPGSVLTTVNSLVNCVATPVASCVAYDTNAPFGCTICATDFYLANGVCTAVGTKIENCVQNATATTCAKCANRTALSVDKLTCSNDPDVVAQVDPSCNNPVILEKPTCNTCKAGYYFKFGRCTACTNQTLAKGCYNCDPNSPSVCLMCASGYYMTAEGDCVSISSVSSSAGRIEAPVTIAKIIADGFALSK